MACLWRPDQAIDVKNAGMCRNRSSEFNLAPNREDHSAIAQLAEDPVSMAVKHNRCITCSFDRLSFDARRITGAPAVAAGCAERVARAVPMMDSRAQLI
jgi:hypothetical protein